MYFIGFLSRENARRVFYDDVQHKNFIHHIPSIIFRKYQRLPLRPISQENILHVADKELFHLPKYHTPPSDPTENVLI